MSIAALNCASCSRDSTGKFLGKQKSRKRLHAALFLSCVGGLCRAPSVLLGVGCAAVGGGCGLGGFAVGCWYGVVADIHYFADAN